MTLPNSGATATVQAPSALTMEPPMRKKPSQLGDFIFANLTRSFAFLALASLAGIIISLFYGAWPSIQKFGLPFIWTSDWNPPAAKFGALIPIYGTLVTSAIALIIDDAIVVVEQIHRTHEENPREPTNKLLKKAIDYLLPAMVGSSLSTIVIFVPFLLMSGVAGAYFKVMTNTMIITLVCSFFVTWIGLPVVYLLLSRKKPAGKQNISGKKQPVDP